MSVISPYISNFFTFKRFTSRLTEFTYKITILKDAIIDYFNCYLHEMDNYYINKKNKQQDTLLPLLNSVKLIHNLKILRTF